QGRAPWPGWHDEERGLQLQEQGSEGDRDHRGRRLGGSSRGEGQVGDGLQGEGRQGQGREGRQGRAVPGSITSACGVSRSLASGACGPDRKKPSLRTAFFVFFA